ncbi:hypothetical protein GCM10027200_26030 [Lentzea nigeriaca]
MNRPKAVDLKTLDPCTLITPETKTALSIRTVEPGSPAPAYGEGSKACGASFEDRKYVWGLDTILNGGPDVLKKNAGEAKVAEVPVAGYPGYQTKQETVGGKPGSCRLYLDVHDGQMLLVTMILPFAAGPESTLDGACERGKTLATAVATTLAAK